MDCYDKNRALLCAQESVLSVDMGLLSIDVK